MRYHFNLIGAAALGGLVALGASQALAKEGGDQYPQGGEGFMAGAVPPPGFYFLGYGIDYRGDLVGNNGDKVALPGGSSVSIRADAVAARALYVSDFQVLGGNWGAHLIVPLFDVRVEAGSASQRKTGLGDITFNPAIMSWHWKDWHLATGLDITAPSGRYDAGDLANIGANYWSFEPLAAVTYRNEDGWEASTKLMYNIKTENTATNYQSGDEFHMDYALVKNFEDWSIGMGGYFVHQIQRDEVNGVEVADSIRRTFAIGPQIQYRYQNMAFSAKWQNEVYSRNTFDGNRFNLKFIYAF
ncbi:MAG: transporter [Rhodospirillum sp.]|nr:transporter [Rhodospirillum sp.]MCF8488754.1 transporter [Rhodospirillum sp.]MCF8499706.1 transporter [Rhodospirillum sp.]